MVLFWWILLFSLIGGVFSLAGGVILLMKRGWAKKHSCTLVGFAAGVLLSAAFLGLLPEALELAEKFDIDFQQLFWWPFLAMVIFFFLERSSVWWHHHHEAKIKPPINLLILIGDGVHNFIDGIVITASFLINIPTGIVTALAVATHEIPQEIADFGIFLKSGMKPKKVFWLNLLSALMTTVGAIAAYSLTDLIIPLQPQLLAFTGGMFIYIAASDLIPELHHEKSRTVAWKQAAAFLLGISLMYLLMQAAHGLK